MNKIAVILPAYNEAMTIAGTLQSFHEQLPDAFYVVIDNNSRDETSKIAADAIASAKMNGVVIFEGRQGKGNAVRRAFLETDADIYVMSDADMTYPADQVGALIAPIIDGRADMVVGDRISGGHYDQENKRRFHGFGNQLVKELVNRLFASDLRDIMTGYRAFNRRFVKHYPVLCEGFQIETDLSLYALDKRFRIIEVPIQYKDRPEGSFSKLNTVSDGAKVIFTIFQILRYYKPLAFFGFFAALLALLGGLTSIPVFSDWIQYRFIHHLPLAVLSAALEISAIMCLGIGLILDAIAHQSKIQFEKDLLRD